MSNVKSLSYAALCVALAFVLATFFKFPLPFGGSATLCSMFFVSFVGYCLGPVYGFASAIAFGLLQFISDPYFVHPIQVLLDYIFAFGCLGISGFFANKKSGLLIGYSLGVIGRFICSSVSGYVFFAAYAPEGWNPIIYTVVYNFSYMFAEWLLTIVLISLPPLARATETIKLRMKG